MKTLRNYENVSKMVKITYELNHREMTTKRVIDLRNKWLKFDKGKYSIKEIIDKLDNLIDDSDPDVDVPNRIHNFQTAESLRRMYPEEDWLHLVGLLHDLGKVMALWGEPQHFVVGDTYPIGCAFSNKIVYSEYFKENIDSYHSIFSTKIGMYYKNCGLKNVIMSWGHDEYMYGVLKNHKSCVLSENALNIIRYHSFYPWHLENEYTHITSVIDELILRPLINKFNEHDLYSKTNDVPDCDKQWNEYYEPLCKKYGLDGKLMW